MRWFSALVAASVVAGCASQSDLNILYNRGIKAARKDDWDAAMKNLAQFTSSACPDYPGLVFV